MLLGFLFRIFFQLFLIIFVWRELEYGKFIYYGEVCGAEILGVWVQTALNNR